MAEGKSIPSNANHLESHMAQKRNKTNYTGVYAREHESRRHKGKPDICYDICYRLPGERKLVWEKVGWVSEKISAAMASNVRAERLKQARVGNLPTEVARLTLDEVFERFRADYLNVARKYPQDAVSIYTNRIQPHLGHLPMLAVTSLEVDALKKEQGKLSADSTKKTLSLLGQIFRQAQRWGIYEGPIPTDTVKVPQFDSRRMRFLTKAEAKTLLDTLHSRSLHLWRMALVSLYTGLRAGEVFNLRWEHVNFTCGTITVMDAKNAENRVVHMPEQVQNVLQSWHTLSKGKTGFLVFPKQNTQNTPLSEIGSHFKVIVRDCGLNEGITDRRHHIVFHSLRHTFASWLVQAGVPLYTVQKLMGHKTITMTQRYAHLAPDQGAEAARVLSGVVLG